ncbi:MAG: trypsin-like peptidase domain-containing protein [Deltaproteobacteria bacterium]|nr:trypsin-like peptidase domain-containing protein [Deltaproteobacteria bacterium]
MQFVRKSIIATSLIVAIAMSASIGRASDASGCDQSISSLFERVSKSVVLITAVSLNPFSVEERISTAMGSGFIVRPDGVILTNSHVVFGRQAIAVTLADGQSIPAALVGADPILDLAVLKIDIQGLSLPVLKLADNVLPMVGDEVLAVGNPLGFEQTLTRGIVSGVNRILPISPMSLTVPMIQTDASINPGNSGGPLVNRCGHVVGINTSVLLGAENMGFALPAVIVQQVLPQLLEKGRVIRPWLGLRGQMVQKDALQSLFNIDVRDGFLVEMVEPGSPADKAEIKGGMLPVEVAGNDFLFGGDIVTTADDVSLNEPNAYEAFARGLKIGTKVKLTVFRQGQIKKVTLKVTERPILPWDLPPEDCHQAMRP